MGGMNEPAIFPSAPLSRATARDDARRKGASRRMPCYCRDPGWMGRGGRCGQVMNARLRLQRIPFARAWPIARRAGLKPKR